MKTRFGVSYWIDRYPKSRQPAYPRLCSRVEAPVAIVGGGLAGCATACALSLAGVGVVVLEAGRIAFGSTGACPGLLRLEPPVSFVSLRDRYGLRASRALWRGFRRAGLEMASTIRRLGIRCECVPDAAIRVGFAPEDEAQLVRERQAMRAAGVEGTWLTAGRLARETGLRRIGGLRSAGDAYIDPYRAALGLAAAASKRQAQFFERSGVVRITRHRQGVDVMTDGGAVRASCVIVATSDPTRLFAPLGRHFTATDTCCVLTDSLPSFVRREFGRSRGMVVDGASPAHVLGRTTADRVLAVGADQPRPGPRARQKAVVQRTAQLMHGLTRLYPAMSGVQPEYGWSVPVSVSSDGLPVIGPHRLYPQHLFALGLGHGGAGAAWLAARALVRHYQGIATPDDALLGFARLR